MLIRQGRIFAETHCHLLTEVASPTYQWKQIPVLQCWWHSLKNVLIFAKNIFWHSALWVTTTLVATIKIIIIILFFYPQFFPPFPSSSIFLIEGGLGSKVDGSAQKPRSGHLPRLAHLFYSGTTLPAVSECPCCPGISAKFDKSRKILKF